MRWPPWRGAGIKLTSIASSLTDVAAAGTATLVGMLVIRATADAIDARRYLKSGTAALRYLDIGQPPNGDASLLAVELFHDAALAAVRPKPAAEEALHLVLRGLCNVVGKDVIEIGLIADIPLERIPPLLLCLPKLSFDTMFYVVISAIFHIENLHCYICKSASP